MLMGLRMAEVVGDNDVDGTHVCVYYALQFSRSENRGSRSIFEV